MASRTGLVEREAELEALDLLLESGLDGGVVLIEGPAGIGKTTLVDEVLLRAEGFDVLTARGGVLEQDLTFGVVRQLLERRMSACGEDERAALLTGPASGAERALGHAALDGPAGAGELGRSLHGLFWLVANLAEQRPLLLVVDDLHWADRGSVEFLCYLARRIQGLPVTIVAAVRDGEPLAHETAIAELARGATVLRPTPLTVDGVRQLVHSITGTDAGAQIVEACRAATGGNPFFVRELLLALLPSGGDPRDIEPDTIHATVPATVARAILLRLGQLPAPARRLATAASLLGDGAALRHAATLGELDDAEAGAASDDLVRASILAGVHPIRFSHPMVSRAIAADEPEAARATAHQLAAKLLRADGAAREQIVPHLLHAAPAGDAWVVDVLRTAAADALAGGLPDLAVRYLRRAIDEPPVTDRSQVHAQLGSAELAAGLYDASATSMGRALEDTADPVARGLLRLPQAYALMASQGAAPALAALDAGAREVGSTEPQLALLLESELAVQVWLTGAEHGVLDRLDRHQQLAGTTPAERFMLANQALDALRREQPVEAVRERALGALADGRMLAEDTSSAMPYYVAVVALLGAEAYADARAATDAGWQDCVRRGSAFGFGGVMWLDALLALARGDLAAAEAAARSSAEHAVPTMTGISLATLALVLLEQGDARAAHDTLQTAGLLDDERPVYVWGPYVRGLVRLAEAKATEALADLQDVRDKAQRVGGFAAILPCGAHLARALLACGDRAGATATATEELERAQRLGADGRIGQARHCLGVVTSEEDQLAHLEAAVEILGATPRRLELARAQLDLGIALLRAGRRRDGRQVLEGCHDLAQACGAFGVVRAADAELKVAGARPRRHRYVGAEALTASERRVAEMARDGMTNREIAELLFVTPKTVENQLGRAYAKLGVSTRRALRDVLERPTEPGDP